jgi:capsular exopolysaccharide synthesis family protein
MSRIYDALKKTERRQRNTPVATPVDGRTAPQIVWDLDDDTWLEYERIQVWITNPSRHHQPIHTVMVASCQSRDGATTTAARLAATLAQRPTAQVLIVDANLRTPCLDLLFGVPIAKGFSELLTNGDLTSSDCVQSTTQPNFFVLTTGRGLRSPLEIISPAALSLVVSQLKARFDFVVFDVPPLLQFPDAYALAPHVDAVLLVVEADRTLVEDARRALRELERVGTRAVGVVLNRQRDYTPRLLRRVLHRANGSRSASA